MIAITFGFFVVVFCVVVFCVCVLEPDEACVSDVCVLAFAEVVADDAFTIDVVAVALSVVDVVAAFTLVFEDVVFADVFSVLVLFSCVSVDSFSVYCLVIFFTALTE